MFLECDPGSVLIGGHVFPLCFAAVARLANCKELLEVVQR